MRALMAFTAVVVSLAPIYCLVRLREQFWPTVPMEFGFVAISMGAATGATLMWSYVRARAGRGEQP